MICDFCCAFFAIFGLSFCVLLNELDVLEIDGYVNKLCHTLNHMCTVMLVFSIYIRYDLWLQWQITLKRKFTKYDNLHNTSLWVNLVFEQLLCLVAPNSFLKGTTISEEIKAFDIMIMYEVNDILLFFSFVRIYLVIRYLFYLTPYYNPRTERVCRIFNSESDFTFAIKIVVNNKPISLIFYVLLVSAVIFSYQLRIFETPLSEISGHDFSSMLKCIWNFVITMNQVGYGDMYAKTNMGRIVVVILCFWGMILNAMFILSVSNSLKFNETEENSYKLLLKL